MLKLCSRCRIKSLRGYYLCGQSISVLSTWITGLCLSQIFHPPSTLPRPPSPPPPPPLRRHHTQTHKYMHTPKAAGGSIVETLSLDKWLLPRAVRLTLTEQSTLCYLCLADKESFWLGENWTIPLCLPHPIQESAPWQGLSYGTLDFLYCLFIRQHADSPPV